MKSSSDFALWFYGRMLHLYPPQFRADYADEMREVFSLALAENEHPLLMLGLLLAEIRELPANVIREYKHKNPNMRVSESIVMVESEKLRTDQFRFCIRAALGVACSYFLLSVLPFFVFGLHLQQPDDIRLGLLPPGQYGLYQFDSPLGDMLRLISFCVMFFTPLAEILFGGVILLIFRRRKLQVSRIERYGGWLAATMSIALLIFAMTPTGNLISIWWFG